MRLNATAHLVAGPWLANRSLDAEAVQGWNSEYADTCIIVVDLVREECEFFGGEVISTVALSLDIVAGGRLDGWMDKSTSGSATAVS
jgi:hypothetical protein